MRAEDLEIGGYIANTLPGYVDGVIEIVHPGFNYLGFTDGRCDSLQSVLARILVGAAIYSPPSRDPQGLDSSTYSNPYAEYASNYAQSILGTFPKEEETCTCEIRDLANFGCKCGYIQKERKRA